MPRAVEILCGAIGVALFVIVVYAGFAGTQTPTANLTPTFIYVVFWVGLVPLSLVLGDMFRPFNPWRATARAVAWIANRAGGDARRSRCNIRNGSGAGRRCPGSSASRGSSSCYVERETDPSTLAVLMPRLRGDPARRHEPVRDRAVVAPR